jgi:hypothetical protein
MDFAIRTEKLSRIYKIRGGKKSEPRSLIALSDINLENTPRRAFWLTWSQWCRENNLD